MDIEDEKIKGVDRKKFENIVEQYISENYKKIQIHLKKEKPIKKKMMK